MSSWDEAKVVEEVPAGYVELTENGFGAMVGWLAGMRNVVRLPDSPGLHTTRITGPDGARYERERSQEEQDVVDDDIDEYLRDCGLPHRPRGFQWFARLPEGVGADDFWPMIIGTTEGVGPHPSETAQAVRELLAARYQL
ncbi:hypothetical protein LFM09_01450 [Lentzea alba]|uniref:DUF5956 family protein n=1 Tax=Lentzea alba TaxID=2714351 RepID=UPI0039BFC0A5